MITHAVIFAPIGQTSRTEQIVHRLANAIVTGLLESDEQLPNEAELARMMGVSHITVRDALNTLRAKELIYTVRGRNGGSFVCGDVKKENQNFHPLKSISTDYLSDLGEMHSAVLSHSARLASRRMTKSDVDKFRNFVDLLATAPTYDLKTQADMRCLLALAAGSQSARLANQELGIQTEWASLVSLLYANENIHRHSVQAYCELLTALEDHDEYSAVKKTLSLIDFFTTELIEYKLRLN